MRFTLSETPTNGLNFRGAMVQTWNKFCFTGGYLEASIRLPGKVSETSSKRIYAGESFPDDEDISFAFLLSEPDRTRSAVYGLVSNSDRRVNKARASRGIVFLIAILHFLSSPDFSLLDDGKPWKSK